MTNNINGIDVSECEHHYTNPVNGTTYHACAIYEQKNELGYWQDTLCEQNPNCYFKQLKRLQEKNEELKKYIKDLQVRKDRYYLQVLEFERQISDWVTFYIKISNIVSGNYEILDSQGLQDLRRIISEFCSDLVTAVTVCQIPDKLFKEQTNEE